MKKLKIEFDFKECKVKITGDRVRIDLLHDKERLLELRSMTESIANLEPNDVDKIINLVLCCETMLQFTSSASFLDTRCYEMQTKVTDKLRELKAKQVLKNI